VANACGLVGPSSQSTDLTVQVDATHHPTNSLPHQHYRDGGWLVTQGSRLPCASRPNEEPYRVQIDLRGDRQVPPVTVVSQPRGRLRSAAPGIARNSLGRAVAGAPRLDSVDNRCRVPEQAPACDERWTVCAQQDRSLGQTHKGTASSLARQGAPDYRQSICLRP
jgi:hypothetical protein